MGNADNGLPMPEIAEREKNFFDGEPPSTDEGKKWYMELQHLADGNIAAVVEEMHETCSKGEILQAVVSHIYFFVMSSIERYRILDDDTLDEDGIPFYQNAFDVCFFMSLCMFLYDTKRVKGMSLRKFLYEHSLMKYNEKESPNYFDFSRPREFCESNSDKQDVSSDPILSEEANLRKHRERLLKKRPVYHPSFEWSAIRKVSEHEWTLYTLLQEADKEVRDTEKRIRNLYNGVYKALVSEMDEHYIERLDVAAEKFCSKVEKLQYKRYLELIKYSFEHINKDKTCYGINLYRLEKELHPYRITSDVNELVNCDDMGAECIRQRAMAMENIVFPKLYKYFGNLPDIESTKYYADTFWSFMDVVVQSSRLIIDKFVEAGAFGEDWEQLFLETTNEFAEIVLYDPSEISDSITPGSQQEFQIYLLEPVDRLIRSHKAIAEIILSGSKSNDDV